MAITRGHWSGCWLLSAVATFPGYRDSSIRSDASLDALPFCPVLGRNLTWAYSEFLVLRIDLYPQPLFSTGSPLLAAQDRTRFFTSDRFTDDYECLCRTTGGKAGDAFPDRDRIYRWWNRFFLARLCDK